jgi:hypothetical protein
MSSEVRSVLESLSRELPSVPTDLLEAAQVVKPEDAIGFLQGAQERIIKHIQSQADEQIAKTRKVCEETFERLTKSEEQNATFLHSAYEYLVCPPLIVADIFVTIFKEVSEGISKELFLPALKKLAEKPETVEQLKALSLTIPDQLTDETAKTFFESVDTLSEKDNETDKRLQSLIKPFFAEVVIDKFLSTTSEAEFEQINEELKKSEIRTELQSAGISVPETLTKENSRSLLISLVLKADEEGEHQARLNTIMERFCAAVSATPKKP